jgi:serine/threonine protein kinase
MTDLRVGSKYRITSKLGSGSFGLVYKGEHVVTRETVAVKLENIETRPPQLLFESKVYKILVGSVGIPRIKWYGIEGDYNVMVMDLLGPSLEILFNKCQKVFTLKTVLMIADQLITRIEYMHTKGFIHRDIKPENFVIGDVSNSNIIYVIDFGLSKKYRDPKTHEHIKPKEGKSLTGTARYASINTHDGKEQSRRDDLESIAYMLIYFLKGKLPWQGFKEKNAEKKFTLIGEMKEKISTDEICEGCPNEFKQFLEEVRLLEFTEEPNYSHYKELFRSLFIDRGFCYDYEFDWVLHAEQNCSKGTCEVSQTHVAYVKKQTSTSSVDRG